MTVKEVISEVSYILGPEGDPSGASLLAGPPAIPYGAGLRLVLSLLLLSVHFCPSRRMAKRLTTYCCHDDKTFITTSVCFVHL